MSQERIMTNFRARTALLSMAWVHEPVPQSRSDPLRNIVENPVVLFDLEIKIRPTSRQ
jgi:hypothetical protein